MTKIHAEFEPLGLSYALNEVSNLGKVSNKMASLCVIGSKDIEKERLDVIIECFVVKEQLGQQAQVLTVHLSLVAINFED